MIEQYIPIIIIVLSALTIILVTYLLYNRYKTSNKYSLWYNALPNIQSELEIFNNRNNNIVVKVVQCSSELCGYLQFTVEDEIVYKAHFVGSVELSITLDLLNNHKRYDNLKRT